MAGHWDGGVLPCSLCDSPWPAGHTISLWTRSPGWPLVPPGHHPAGSQRFYFPVDPRGAGLPWFHFLVTSPLVICHLYPNPAFSSSTSPTPCAQASPRPRAVCLLVRRSSGWRPTRAPPRVGAGWCTVLTLSSFLRYACPLSFLVIYSLEVFFHSLQETCFLGHLLPFTEKVRFPGIEGKLASLPPS